MMDRKTISIMKACELVGVSRRTIYNWIASGKVEYVRTAGGSVRIFVDTLWREPGRAARADAAQKPHDAGSRRSHSANRWTSRATSGLLFHRLNNQLGIILANAELLEAKAADEMARARAAQVVASVLDAMATAREIRLRTSRLRPPWGQTPVRPPTVRSGSDPDSLGDQTSLVRPSRQHRQISDSQCQKPNFDDLGTPMTLFPPLHAHSTQLTTTAPSA